MARLIPQKQIEEVNIFKDNISVKKSVFISGSLLVSQSIDIGSDLTTPQRITGSVEITGSLEIAGALSFANAEDRLDATASFADESVDTQRFGGILAKEFGESDATLYVSSTNGSDDNDGRTPQFPLRTIKKAAKIATDGDDGRYGLPTGSLFTGFAIKVDTGTYLEDNPIELPKNTTVWGSGLRVTKVLAKNENEDLFWVNSGNYLSEMTFGNLRVFPSVDVSEKGFAVAFAPNAFITTSPYVQNCSMISNQENSFLEAYEEIPPGGGGLNVDGNRIHPDSPLASMVLDAYTQIAPNGVGCQVVGRGFIQLVSFFTNFSAYSVKVIDGGQAVLLNSNTSFGDFGMYASGSRFITGSGGNADAFFNVQDNYSIIIDTIKNGLSSIPDLVPNTFEGRRLTDPNEVPQYFVSEDSTTDVANRVKSDFRLVSSIVEDGITNVPKLLAKSGKGGYGPESLYNVAGGTQYTSEVTASADDIEIIDTNFDITLDIIERGNVATSSYIQIDNVSASIKVSDVEQYKTFAVQSDTNQTIVDRFDTVISIIENGLTFSPDVSSSTKAGYVFTDTSIYETDVTASLETIQSVSSSFSIVYDILANGTGSLPTTILSSSVENPSVDIQNAYTLLIENIPFIQDETIAYLSSSWSEHPYNQETCKRDVGFIISSSAHDLLFGGNEESIRSGVYYYQFPSNATTTEKDPTLTGVKYASELAINILDGKVFTEASADLDNAYDLIYNNKSFIQSESIAYISSSWSTFDYNEAKCVRDIGYILDAVATDINYGGNERSVTAGEFYYKYPSLATVNNRTTGQLQQTLDGIKYAKRITQKLTNNETFVTASSSVTNAVELIKENRSLIQNETITYVDTQYPNFSYDRVKCKRDTGYIIDNVLTDLLYGGNERSELAGLYYFLYPSIANTTQLEETLEAIRYTKEFTKAVAQSIVLETPQIILSSDGNIRVTQFTPTTGSISATDTEVTIVSQSFGIIEDIIRYGTDSVLSSIAGNSDEYIWNLENPLNVSGITQVTSSGVATDDTTDLITSSFDTVIKIIESGSSIQTEETIGTDSKGNPISTVGIPKNSYGDNLVKTTIGTIIPSDITLVKNTEAGIKFGNGSQTSSSISVDESTISKVSSSFSTITDIINYGISGSLSVSGSSDTSTYFEVVSLYDGSFSIAKTQLQKFDDVDGKVLGEDTGSFEDSVKDPTLTLKRGDLYTFSVNSLNIVNAISIETQPFIIATDRSTDTKFRYNSGITNNGTTFGTVTFIVPFDAPDRLFYVNGNDVSASGVINIVDELPLSDTQRYVEVPSLGSFEVITNTVDNIKVSSISQYTLEYTASVSESNQISSSFATTIDILTNGVDNLPTIIENTSGSIKVTNTSQITSSITPSQYELDYVSSSYEIVIDVLENGMGYTPTNATYDPATGDFVMTIENHSYGVSDSIYLRPESFTFTCGMDDNKTEHNLPSVGQIAYTNKLPITSVTDNTITVNVGKSGPNVEFTPTTASYDPATGDFVMTVESHSLSVGEGIIMDVESFAFTCDMDNDQSVKSYPRLGIDPYAGRSMKITSITDTTMTVNVGASGPNKFFTPTNADYNALTGDMTLTVSESFGLGVGRSVVLENESIAFTCDMDGNATTHSYPRSGSDPYAEQSIIITSVGTTSHSVTDAPYNASNGDVTITIAGHGFSNGDYIKLSDNSLTYTCVLDGNTTQKSYPRTGIDYPSGRWLEISNVTTNTFDINIGSSPYTAAHTFVSATTNGLERQDGTFTINVGDAGSASGSIHTFVSSSNEAVKHLPQSIHTFVSASNGAVKHLPQSTHTFVRTTENSVSSLPIEISNTSASIKVTDTPQYISSSVSGTLENVNFISESVSIVYNIVQLSTSGSYTASLYDTGSGPSTDESTIAAYEIIRNNIPFIQSESLAYLSSSWSTASYDEAKCGRDIGLIISGAAEDLIWNTISASVVNGKFYLEYPSQAETSQLNQTLDGIEYASKLTQKLIQNIEFVTASSEASTSHQLLLDNKLLIQNETIEYISSSWSDFSYSEVLCRRDIGHIVDAAATDILYGGNERSVQAASFYYSNPSSATGSQLNQTVDSINYARRISDKIIQNNKLEFQTLETLQVAELITQNRSLIQEETIQFLSSSWSAFEYNEAKCRRDTGYIVDAVVTDFVYGGNERSINAGEFYYLYPSDATGSQLTQTVDGIEYAQRLTNKLINNITLVTASVERQTAHSLLMDNRSLIQDEVISFMSSSWSNFEYNDIKCRRDVGHVIDAVSTDTLYGGNERSVIAGEFYYLYPSEATTTQSDQTITGILHAAGLANKVIQSTTLVNASDEKISAYNAILENRELVQNNVTEFIDQLYPYFTYNRVKCRRDTGYIIDAVATDLLWGGNERSIVAGDYYYRFPSQTTSLELTETTMAIEYAKIMINKIIKNTQLVVPTIDKNTDANIRFTDTERYSGSLSISGSNLTDISSSFSVVVDTIQNGLSVLPTEVKSINGLTKVTNATQITSSLSGSETQIGIISASIDMINDIIRLGSDDIPFAIAKNFQTSELDTPQNLTTSSYVTIGGTYDIDDELAIVTGSFIEINDIIETGTGSLPTLVLNTENNIKVTSVEQFTSLVSGSQTEITKVSASVDIVENIVQNGVSVIPTIVDNNTNIDRLIKVGNVEQYVSASGADKIQSKILSSSFGLVIDGLTNGTGSLPTISDYSELVDAPKTVLAYNLIQENIDFIKEETILFMSSSWSNFVYNQESCSRDVGLIVSGAAEDLIRNSNSASVVNTKFYFEYPSDATGSQLDQTTTAIKYASNLVQNIVRNYEYTTASAEVSASYDLLFENKEFIVSESLEFVSSSWSDFDYNQNTCGRDIRYIVDAAATDLLYGGNERSVIAGRYYYDYPSSAIVGGVPSSTQQKDPTVTAINYVKGLVSELVGGTIFQTSSNEVEYVYDSIRTNREFIQNETIAFVNAKYPNLQYNEASCSRDTGFIVDAVATDLRWGGNQRSLTAGEFYYRFPSKATNVQLGETTDAVTYASDLVKEIVLKNTLTIPTQTENTEGLIKVTSDVQTLGSGSTEISVLNSLSSSFGLVMDIVTNGTGSIPTITDYTASLTDSEAINAYDLLKSNIGFIQSETIAYISSSWADFSYNEASCSRDVGLIVSGAAEDLLFGSVSASVVNGKFYYEYPSDATGSQLNQTLDGIRYAGRLANNIVQNLTYVSPSDESVTSHNLLRDNKEFIQSESIAYVSSSWSSFYYNEETCKRDIAHIVNALSTDILYGGNERSVIAGDFYHRYPSNATTSELEPTTTGIEYAGDLAEKMIVNEIFESPTSESIAGNKTLLENRVFIQNEVIAYISSSWSNFEYNEASCSRDTGYIVDAVATDFLYGGNERSRTAGEFYYKYPSSATVAGTESPNVDAQLYPTIDGIRHANGISQKLVQNIEFVTASNEVSSSWNLLRDNKEFVQNEVIAYVSSSWSGVYYNEDKCKRDVGYLIDAAATDLYYGGNERSINAGSFYYLFPSSATEKGVPSTTAQLDPTVDGIRYAGKLSTKVIKNEPFVQPSASVLVGADLLVGNKEMIQKETIAFLSSSWSEFEYNEASCSRDLGYIIDAVRTDLVYGGNERSVQAGTFYYYIPSVATTEQKPQTTDGIDFAKGLSEKVILKEQLVRAPFQTRESVDYLKASKKELQSIAISYTNAAFPGFEYNEEKCYRDTGFILDAIATDLYYGGNERSIAAAESYYTGVYGDAAEVITNQQYETADVNRYLRTQFQRVVRNSPLEQFGSLIITTGHDFSYAGSGVTYKALPPNQGGAGIPDPDKEITEIAGGRVFFTSGNELGDFRIGTGLVINQATGTLQGRTFSRSLFSLVTPFSLALEG